MTAVLLNTHAWAWSLTGDARPSTRARTAMTEADTVLISPITFLEIAQKVRLGKWPGMVPFVDRLRDVLEDQGGAMADLGSTICIAAGLMDWSHRDPFDRLLAATARQDAPPIVSADVIFDDLVEPSRIAGETVAAPGSRTNRSTCA